MHWSMAREVRQLGFVMLAGVALGACETTRPCCVVPLVQADVTVSWTVNGVAAGTGCARAGATTVRVEILSDTLRQLDDVTCAEGHAVLRATVFQAPGPGSSVGVAFVRLLDAASKELTAVRVPLTRTETGVSTSAPLVVPRPGGSIRYRWCQPLAAASTLRVSADGPMWAEAVAPASATELVFPALAAGRYSLTAVAASGQPKVGPAVTRADVTDGVETLVKVAECPP